MRRSTDPANERRRVARVAGHGSGRVRLVATALTSSLLACSVVGTGGASALPGSRASHASADLPHAVVVPLNDDFPRHVPVEKGLEFSREFTFLARGTVLTPGQARGVEDVSGSVVRWGVYHAQASQYPVRSRDAGRTWMVMGPSLSGDWAGGSTFLVTESFALNEDCVYYASNSVIDLSMNAGRTWYQAINVTFAWSITPHVFSGNVLGFRATGRPGGAPSLRHDVALYVLDLAHHQWRRLSLTRG